MGEINVPREEQEAILGIDTGQLTKLIRQALDDRNANSLASLKLDDCGPYIYPKFHGSIFHCSVIAGQSQSA